MRASIMLPESFFNKPADEPVKGMVLFSRAV
jgi:hypothetical protein